MKLIADQLASLQSLDIPQTKRPDFDAFWAEAIRLCGKKPLRTRAKTVDHAIRSIEVRDVTYSGLDGTPVHAWVLLPPEARRRRVPAVVRYHGAGGNRGCPHQFADWLLMGMAVVSMDYRMQSGLTGSDTGFVSGSSDPKWFALGLLDKRSNYFYHAWTDGLRAIRLAREAPEIDPRRVIVDGGSQGGGASLVMAALDPGVALCLADVPSHCWMEKRVMMRAGSASAIASFLQSHPESVDEVCETLSYFDVLNLADRIRCPTLVSCGLKDPVCPPECVYAAFNKITAPKEICPYPFGEHDGGGANHVQRKLAFVREWMDKGR